MGIAHVSCLVKQARVLTADDGDKQNSWWSCRLCRQSHRVPLKLALSWANWATYLHRPITNKYRGIAIYTVGNSLVQLSRPAEALPILQACLDECYIRIRYHGWDPKEAKELLRGYEHAVAQCQRSL